MIKLLNNKDKIGDGASYVLRILLTIIHSEFATNIILYELFLVLEFKINTPQNIRCHVTIKRNLVLVSLVTCCVGIALDACLIQIVWMVPLVCSLLDSFK